MRLPEPDERVECLGCHHWPMAKNWADHLLSQGQHWPAPALDSEELGLMEQVMDAPNIEVAATRHQRLDKYRATQKGAS